MNNLLNIKSFLKFLSRNKGYTAIDVFGLSVSLMFVILPQVFNSMGDAGGIIGCVFFILVIFAALTSSISLVETCTSIILLAGRAVSGDRESLSGHHGSREE